MFGCGSWWWRWYNMQQALKNIYNNDKYRQKKFPPFFGFFLKEKTHNNERLFLTCLKKKQSLAFSFFGNNVVSF
jgi:hypothetical protein